MKNKIEEKFKEYYINMMNYRLKQCLLGLIYDLCDHTKTEKEYVEPAEIAKIKLDFFSLAKELSSVLEKPLDERQEYLDKLLNLKEAIIKQSNPVIFYDNCLSQTAIIILNKYKTNILSQEECRPFDFHMILHDCQEYISSIDDPIEKDNKKGLLISCLPHLMTKSEFEDYLNSSLRILFENAPVKFIKASIEVLKSQLAPFKNLDISEQYPLIADKINEIRNMDLTDKPNEELEELLSTIDDTQSTLDTIGSDYNMLYNDINFLYAIGAYCVDKEQLFDNDFELKDLYFSACELTESENAEAFSETIYDAVEKRIEDLYDIIEKEENNIRKYISKITPKQFDEFDETTKFFIDITTTITSLYMDELILELKGMNALNYNSELATENDINSAIEEMIDFTKNLSQYYTPSQLKLAKQAFMEKLPCPYSDNKLLDYIRNTLDTINGKEIFYISVDSIGHLFNDEGFLNMDAEHSHDNCSCGHDHSHEHHHDDNCNCGHHHH